MFFWMSSNFFFGCPQTHGKFDLVRAEIYLGRPDTTTELSFSIEAQFEVKVDDPLALNRLHQTLTEG